MKSNQHNSASECSGVLNPLTKNKQITILKTLNTQDVVSPTKDLMGTLEQQARALQQQALKLREKELREVPQDGDGLWLRTRNLQYIVRVLIDAADNLLSLAGVNVALAIEEAVE